MTDNRSDTQLHHTGMHSSWSFAVIYAPFLFAAIGSILQISGHISFNWKSILIISLQILIAMESLRNILKHQQWELPHPSAHISLPLLFLSINWNINTLLGPARTPWLLGSALVFGLTIGLTRRFIQPFIFFAGFCLEVALELTDSINFDYVSLSVHLVAGLTIPLFISRDRLYFMVNPHRLVRHTQRSGVLSQEHPRNITPAEVNTQGIVEELLLVGNPTMKHPAEQPISNAAKVVIDGLHGKSRSGEHDLGLLTHQVPQFQQLSKLQMLQSLSQEHTNQAIEFIKRSFKVQLDLLQQQLKLDSAVVLWRKTATNVCDLRAVISDRQEWLEGPYPADYGILEGAFDQPVILSDPVEASLVIPYYDRRVTLGAFMSYPIRLEGDHDANGVLCIDRSINEPWATGDQQIVEMTAHKLAIDIETGRLLKLLARDRYLVERLCLGLKGLNESLDLEGVTQAAIDGVRVHQNSDFIAFCLREGDGVRILRCWSSFIPSELEEPHSLDNVYFEFGEDLISLTILGGVMIDSNDPLHDGRSVIPLVVHELSRMHSAVIFPLKGEEEFAYGALLVASQKQSPIQSPHLEPLQLIVEQIGVKLELAHAHEKLRDLASRDGLTGLKNHMTYQSTLDQMLSRARRNLTSLAIILLDIDFFKRLNDNYGHPFGDIVLKQVAKTVEAEMREIDLVARYGGEEFAIALEGNELGVAMNTAERIRQCVESLRFSYEDQEISVTISLGVACFPTDGTEKEELIDRADKALYQSKRRGRNQVTAWRSIVSDDRNTSVGWTRSPMAILEVLEADDTSPINQPITEPLH